MIGFPQRKGAMKRMRACVLLVAAIACGSVESPPPQSGPFGPADPTGRAPVDTTLPPQGLHGYVTGDDRLPVANAAIIIGGDPSTPASAFTDSAGAYALSSYRLDTGPFADAYVIAAKPGYDSDERLITTLAQSFHLYRHKQITAGDSTSVDVASDDGLCGDYRYVCRTVHIVIPRTGVLRVEIRPSPSGMDATMCVNWPGATGTGSYSCSNGNAPLEVSGATANGEAQASITMTKTGIFTQSFVVTTSLTLP
jgi:hypothetical protein